jgi:hypothetical protein
MGPQNCQDGKYPNAMIKYFRALHDNKQDTTCRVTLYNGMWKSIKNMSHNKKYILDEQLHAMQLRIYHGIKVHVEDLEGERISQIGQYTESQAGTEGTNRTTGCG